MQIEEMSDEEIEKYLRMFRKEVIEAFGIPEVELKSAKPTPHYCSAGCRIS